VIGESGFQRRRVQRSEKEHRTIGDRVAKSEAATQDSLEGYARISVNLRNLGLYDEDLSRRDSVKEAQYEVLGNDAKRHVRPDRDDRKRSAFWSRAPLSDCQHRSIVPSGTDSPLRTLTQHFVLGYFREVPAGLTFSPPTAILIATS
jgi:hypothetical protein